jgi:hypothetical protein
MAHTLGFQVEYVCVSVLEMTDLFDFLVNADM